MNSEPSKISTADRIRAFRDRQASRSQEALANDSLPSAQDQVAGWIDLLATSRLPAAEATESKELDALRRVMVSVSLAAEEGIINSDEAEAMQSFVIERFIRRKFDKLIRRVTDPTLQSYFSSYKSGEPNERVEHEQHRARRILAILGEFKV